VEKWGGYLPGVSARCLDNARLPTLAARKTVPTPTPSSVAIFLQPQPCVRRAAILEGINSA
jgi:hypothetical protein